MIIFSTFILSNYPDNTITHTKGRFMGILCIHDKGFLVGPDVLSLCNKVCLLPIFHTSNTICLFLQLET